MGRFLFWLILFIFACGISLHYKFDVPYVLSWIGNLPGDTVVKQGRILYYLPITSAAIFAFVVTVLFSSFHKK